MTLRSVHGRHGRRFPNPIEYVPPFTHADQNHISHQNTRVRRDSTATPTVLRPQNCCHVSLPMSACWIRSLKFELHLVGSPLRQGNAAFYAGMYWRAHGKYLSTSLIDMIASVLSHDTPFVLPVALMNPSALIPAGCRAIHSTPRGPSLSPPTLSLGQCAVQPLPTCSMSVRELLPLALCAKLYIGGYERTCVLFIKHCDFSATNAATHGPVRLLIFKNDDVLAYIRPCNVSCRRAYTAALPTLQHRTTELGYSNTAVPL